MCIYEYVYVNMYILDRQTDIAYGFVTLDRQTPGLRSWEPIRYSSLDKCRNMIPEYLHKMELSVDADFFLLK